MVKKLMSDECFREMLDYPLLAFPAKYDNNDIREDGLGRALALYYLTLAEHENPGNEEIISRVLAHFDAATSEGQAPAFDAICLWCYCPYSAAIALAKATPSIWSRVSPALCEKLTFTMEMYAYLESFATSDENSYSTGPGLAGNYHKGWNPNYRLANVPAILFAAHFFGDGDAVRGAKVVNDMLHAFDEAAYTRVILTLGRYGWHRALAVWTAAGPVARDGSQGSSAKELLLRGGPAYALNYTHTQVNTNAGDGKGVGNGGADYLYHGYPLSDAPAIIRDLLVFNYSGGEVKSDHHFDVDGDGVAEKIAWIVDESESPYQGRVGMMKEFASGNRSSTGYCSHDFLLTTCLISAANALGLFYIVSDPALWEMVKVGNGDFLYKNERGYLCFATGSYGTSHHAHSEENEGKVYFATKSLWLTALCDD